jgi:hemerythrin-like metal-binding protein
MFEFKDDYLVGVTAIDEQHKQLFRLAQRFHDAVMAHKGKAMLLELLDALLRYTTGHFRVEERLMAGIGYPEQESHQVQHRELRERLLASQERFENGEMVTIQLLQFMTRLTAHITSTDRELGEFHRTKTSPPQSLAS